MIDPSDDEDRSSCAGDNDDGDNGGDGGFRVFSGQTDEARREIRRSQRLLAKEIPDLDILEASERNNEINRKVRYIRESVLDAQNLDDIAKKLTDKVDSMVKVPRYDVDRVISKLVQQCRITKGGASYFDWHGLGIQAGVCFNAIPSQVSFLNGPLVDGTEEIRVKQRARRVRDTQPESDAEEERPDEIKGHTKRGADQLGAIQKNMHDMKAALKKKQGKSYMAKKRKIEEFYGGNESVPKKALSRLKKHQDICAVNLLFNPKSFTQTVENMYHYSFLVKEGTASLAVRNEKALDNEGNFSVDGGPVAKFLKENRGGNDPPARQAIINLSMQDWRDLVEAYGVEKSDVPHRGP